MESQLSSAKDELDRARRDFTLERELLNDRLLQAAKDLEEARSKVSRKDGECSHPGHAIATSLSHLYHRKPDSSHERANPKPTAQGGLGSQRCAAGQAISSRRGLCHLSPLPKVKALRPDLIAPFPSCIDLAE